jgi:hypothetical protein
MKKSEMLGKLFTYLYQETDLNETSLEDLCIDILDIIEDSGMQPPSQYLLNGDESNKWELE